MQLKRFKHCVEINAKPHMEVTLECRQIVPNSAALIAATFAASKSLATASLACDCARASVSPISGDCIELEDIVPAATVVDDF